MLYSTCFTHLFLVVCVGMFMGYGGVGCSGLWSRLWEASYGRGCGKLADGMMKITDLVPPRGTLR